MNRQEVIIETHIEQIGGSLLPFKTLCDTFYKELEEELRKALLNACDSHSCLDENKKPFIPKERVTRCASPEGEREIFVLDDKILLLEIQYDKEKPFWAKVIKYING